MKYIKKLVSRKKLMKVTVFVFLTTILCLSAFLTVNLVLFYNKNVPKNYNVPLYYEFKQDTVAVNCNEAPMILNLQERYLSYKVSYGIDVSEWQGEIDWQKVKATGISFVMIRCGFRQIAGSLIKEDRAFKNYIKGAQEAGLKVGVYFFGTAKNEKEAQEEAEFTLNMIKDYDITYPVAYDIESFNDGRLKGVDPSIITDNVLAFTETIAAAGYDTMVYSYKNALTNTLDTGRLEGKLIWLAHYVKDTNYKGNYHMWQYSSEGRVDGIKTNVDLNVSYIDYVYNPEEVVNNPKHIDKAKIVLAPMDEQAKTTNKTILRSSPETGPNKMGTLKRGTVVKRTGVFNDYSQIEYNGKSYFVLSKNLIKTGNA